MAYFFLLLGCLLMIAGLKLGLKAGNYTIPQRESLPTLPAKGLDSRLEELGDKVELLSLAITRVAEQLARGGQKREEEEVNFQQVLISRKKLDEYQDIYQAYDQGKDITELAKSFNRGKGEIQLILSLRASNYSSDGMAN